MRVTAFVLIQPLAFLNEKGLKKGRFLSEFYLVQYDLLIHKIAISPDKKVNIYLHGTKNSL
jgi:hypothetical protein